MLCINPVRTNSISTGSPSFGEWWDTPQISGPGRQPRANLLKGSPFWGQQSLAHCLDFRLLSTILLLLVD